MMRRRSSLRTLVGSVSLLLVAGLARAEGEEKEAPKEAGSIESAAGSEGVTEADQAKARELFREGNLLVRESLFVQAVDKYEQALSLWDHPGIHYNLALALLNLDQPLRMRTHLLATLSAGERRVGEDKFRRAEEYLKLVEKQLSRFSVEVREPGAKVVFDGEPLFVAPGKRELVLEPGRHELVVEKAGFETRSEKILLVPGDAREVSWKLYRPEQYVRYEQRWQPVLPWSTAIGGAVVLAAGAIVFWQGGEQIASYDERVRRECAAGGCLEFEGSADSGRTLQSVGLSGMILGGAAAATGGVLLYLNRPIARRVDPETGASLEVSPSLTTSTSGFLLRGTF